MNLITKESGRLGLQQNTALIEVGQHGIVIEREGALITVYATDNTHSDVYAAVPFATEAMVNARNYTVSATEDDSLALVGIESCLIAVFFDEKKIATSAELPVYGSEAWGYDCKKMWDEELSSLYQTRKDD